ncbi:hypothetical protein ZIOFF_001800 [Zingiber officinale]|uniref:DUF7477 domain-containing protein n=1 Tax=Zingiber officinale TaxID=94328 RepID=A0A8J5LVB4_ZINOF|nr:hypothetical protein ZIOFF_001800 [Zingiber officinale]
MTTAGSRWGVVMSRNSGYSNQVVELDFLYPSEGIHQRWERGYRITSTAATPDQAALILSIPKRKMMDETQETLRTSSFPSNHVKVENPHGTVNKPRTTLYGESALRNRKMGKKSLHCFHMLRSNSVLILELAYTSETERKHIEVALTRKSLQRSASYMSGVDVHHELNQGMKQGLAGIFSPCHLMCVLEFDSGSGYRSENTKPKCFVASSVMQLRTKVRLSVYVALVLTQVKWKKELFWFLYFQEHFVFNN